MSSQSYRVVAYSRGQTRTRRDELAVEEPLEIRVDTRPVSVTMRTPGQDEELAAGFLYSEGLLRNRAQIQAIKPHPRNPNRNILDVFLAPGVHVNLDRLARRVFSNSSCGLCGKTSIRHVRQQFRPATTRVTVRGAVLLNLPDTMRAHQETFARTGGLHAAAIFNIHGELLVLREDIGRHNAVDKVIGYGVLNDLLPFDECVLMVSGRASFEIMQKALAARVPIVGAVSAPSSLAVDFAIESRQTLFGFMRDGRMNVYAGRKRIV